MVEYYLFLILIICLILLDVLSRSHKKNLIFISAIIIFVFLGLRYKIGVDWLFYYDDYRGVKNTLAIEPGYKMISWLSSLLLNFWVFVSMITLAIVISIARFAHRFSPYPVLVFGSYFIISFGFNVEALRQILAVALFYIAIYDYLKGRRYLFYLWCVIGSVLHISLLPLIVLPLFISNCFLKVGRGLFLLGVLLTFINIYPVKELINIGNVLIGGPYFSKIAWYALNNNENSGITFNLLFKIIIYIYFIYNRNKILTYCQAKEISFSTIKTLDVMFLTMLLVDIYFLPFGTISSRYDEYFVPAMLICFSYSLKVNNIYANRIIIGSTFIAILSVSFIRFTMNEYFREQYTPYANSIIQIFSNSTDDAARAKAVYLHWKLSNQ
ncbi:EpsG family protein [Pantoea sp. USHLN256]|uniref:EpsG family protein n=1 Tax=Pantoea sp. USHLN256 TaxID=3081293 RepID=UPI0030173062